MASSYEEAFKSMKFSKLLSLKYEENVDRKQWITATLLAYSIVAMAAGTIIHLYHILFPTEGNNDYANNAIGIGANALILAFFILLFNQSKKKYYKIVAAILLLSLYLLSTYMGYIWGIDLPASTLFFSLIVVMSGILISSLFSFISTAIIIVTIALINYFQRIGSIPMNDYWRMETWTISNVLMVSIIFAIIATASWLSNKETEKALKKAEDNNLRLIRQRNSISIKLKEKEDELRREQAEKMAQLSQFAEYGKLAGGLFHDITSPLTSVSINIERMADKKLYKDKNYIEPEIIMAKAAIKKMEKMVTTTRKQFSGQKVCMEFSINQEIKDAITLLDYKAKEVDAIIHFPIYPDYYIRGNPIRFNQIITNLISNALDACRESLSKRRRVTVSLTNKSKSIIIIVKDNGHGIPVEIRDKIFDIFTTKKMEEGSGVGLFLTKEIVENEFGGKISFNSKKREETTFIISLPKHYNEKREEEVSQ